MVFVLELGKLHCFVFTDRHVLNTLLRTVVLQVIVRLMAAILIQPKNIFFFMRVIVIEERRPYTVFKLLVFFI